MDRELWLRRSILALLPLFVISTLLSGIYAVMSPVFWGLLILMIVLPLMLKKITTEETPSDKRWRMILLIFSLATVTLSAIALGFLLASAKYI